MMFKDSETRIWWGLVSRNYVENSCRKIRRSFQAPYVTVTLFGQRSGEACPKKPHTRNSMPGLCGGAEAQQTKHLVLRRSATKNRKVTAAMQRQKEEEDAR